MIPILLRFAFRLLYHQLAWTYDWVAAIVSVGMWNRWVLSVIPEIKGPAVLELGPGPGHLLKALYERDIGVIGLEYSPQMIRRAGRMLLDAGHTPRICRGDGRRMPFSGDSFDTIVATFPAEYVGEPQTWLEAGRVLKNGGRFVILMGAGLEGGGLAQRIAGWVFRLAGQVDENGEIDWEGRLQEFLADKPLRAGVVRKKVSSGTVVMIVAEKI